MTFSDYPITLVWDITYDCNFDCKHCYINDGIKRKDLPSERLFEITFELIKNGIFYLDIGGGEPLLRKKDLLKVIQIANSGNIECTVATNGWFLTKPVVKELKDSGLKRILVSLDGSNEKIHDKFRSKKDAFNKAIRGIKNCIEEGIETYTISTLTQKNYDDILNIIKLSEKLKCDGIIIAKFVPFGSGETNKEELMIDNEDYYQKLKQIKNLKNKINISIKEDCGPTSEKIEDMCHAGKFIGAIRPNGDIVPCAFFPLIIGNVSKHSFSEVWRNSKVINSLKTDNYLKEIKDCEDCLHLKKCKGGCKGRSQTYFGTWLYKDPCCSQKKTIKN
jgi:AdoMet-dependent heme synthase